MLVVLHWAESSPTFLPLGLSPTLVRTPADLASLSANDGLSRLCLLRALWTCIAHPVAPWTVLHSRHGLLGHRALASKIKLTCCDSLRHCDLLLAQVVALDCASQALRLGRCLGHKRRTRSGVRQRGAPRPVCSGQRGEPAAVRSHLGVALESLALPRNFPPRADEVGFAKMRGLAVDGNCKTFDSSADGFARGEGMGEDPTSQKMGSQAHLLCPYRTEAPCMWHSQRRLLQRHWWVALCAAQGI